MSLFEVKITSSKAACNELGYYFKAGDSSEYLSEGDTVTISVLGGIEDFTWESLTPGISVGNATTTVRNNTVTCDYFPTISDRRAQIKVTDSCGNVTNCFIALVDDIENGCISGDCASANPLTVSGPTVDVKVGSQFTGSGGTTPYRWRGIDLALDGTGEIKGDRRVTSETKHRTITVIDMCGKRASIEVDMLVPEITAFNPWNPIVGEIVTYPPTMGCDDDPRWSIDCGAINKKTGEIVSLDGCECNETITVSVDDSCGNDYGEAETNENYVPVVVSGPEDAVVGSVYSASGGVAPYSWSFDSGTIDSETGEILSINDCGESGSSRAGNAIATDSCGNSSQLEVRLPGGHWVGGEHPCGTYYSDSPQREPECSEFSYDPGAPSITYQYIIGGAMYTEGIGIIPVAEPDCGNADHVPGDTGNRTTKEGLDCTAQYSGGGGVYKVSVLDIQIARWEC